MTSLGSPGFSAAEMADSPLRHGSLLPDWLVNSHNQILAPSGRLREGMIGKDTETHSPHIHIIPLL